MTRNESRFDAALAAFDRELEASGVEFAIGDEALPPNNGTSANINHWRVIDRVASALRKRGYTDLRVDQQQVVTRPDGRTVYIGQNKPDIQAVHYAPGRRRRFIVEVDTDPKASRAHQDQITAQDPTARGVYVVIDPNSGRVLNYRTYNPATGRETTRTRKPFPRRAVRR